MSVKLVLRWFLSIVVIFGFFIGNPFLVKAQTSKVDDELVSLLTLGQQDTILTGPQDSRTILFRLPADWSMLSGSTLHVDLTAATGITQGSASGIAGFFEVYLNETWLTTINLTADGEYSVDIPIPASAWMTSISNTSQKLKFVLVDALRCEMWLSASAAGGSVHGLSTVLHSSSYITFKYDTVPASTDLKLFPYPIYQATFKADSTVLIVPDQPTHGEIQAAMSISAALGRLTNGRLNLQLSTNSGLNDSLSNESSLIFVGTPISFPQLASANFPAPYTGKSFANVQMGADDGILQMAVSPQNPSRVWLWVSGNSDAAIIKAAQAIGSDQIQPYGPENLAIISEVQTDRNNTDKTDFTFAELGYPFDQSYSGFYNDLGIWFEMPAKQIASEGAYFEMVFTNSAILDFDSSDIKVSINDSLIGGLRFSDKTTSTTNWKFNIPTNLLHPGRNLLLLQLTLAGSSPCISPDDLWLSISPASLLHLPVSPNTGNANQELELANYPNATFSAFDQTALVLPSNDPFAWSVASKLAFDLGRQLGGANFDIAAYYADAVSDDVLRARDLLLVGRASTMPVMTKFSQVMPAPFENGKDIAQEKDPQYSFLVTENVPMGYIQVFSSPWDSKLTVLSISGNANEGLDSAVTALLSSTYRRQMVGNFVVVMKNKLIVQKVDVTNSSQTSPEIILPNSQNSDNTEQTGSTGKINVSLPLVVLVVVIILVAMGIIVFFVMGKEDEQKKK